MQNTKLCTPLYSTYNGIYSIAFLVIFYSSLSTFYGIVEFIMFKHLQGKIVVIIPLAAITLVTPWYVTSTFTNNQKENNINQSVNTAFIPHITQKIRIGNYVVIQLDTNTLLLKNGTTTLKSIPIVSQGKPGSYYETIGGEYTSDFKEVTHLSSIGHVFMPYSVHIFGNYFIHGIPYYPDGTKVSSAFSGGCVRLEDEDAAYVYNFVHEGTPIILTRGNDTDFLPTSTTTNNLREDMTRIMTATISLESLNQDNEILNHGASTTRKELLTKILSNDSFDESLLYKNNEEKKLFIEAMNSKAKSLGLTNTLFTDTSGFTNTSDEDYLRFMEYIKTYKSFLLQY